MPNSLRSLSALNGRKFTEQFFLPGQRKSVMGAAQGRASIGAARMDAPRNRRNAAPMRRHPAAGRLTTARCGPTIGTVRLMSQPQVLVPPAQYWQTMGLRYWQVFALQYWQALWLAVMFTAHSRSNTYCRPIPRHRRQYRHPNHTRQKRRHCHPNPPRQTRRPSGLAFRRFRDASMRVAPMDAGAIFLNKAPAKNMFRELPSVQRLQRAQRI